MNIMRRYRCEDSGYAASEGGDLKKHNEEVHENLRNLEHDSFSSHGLLQVIYFCPHAIHQCAFSNYSLTLSIDILL